MEKFDVLFALVYAFGPVRRYNFQNSVSLFTYVKQR